MTTARAATLVADPVRRDKASPPDPSQNERGEGGERKSDRVEKEPAEAFPSALFCANVVRAVKKN